MRWKFPALALIITFMSLVVISQRSEAQTVNIDLFYEELSPHGQWYPHPEFGDVWQPYDVGPQWIPYTDGRWAWSDQGWIWISYEPWGWATYHYGRWIYDDYQGWIWIPGTTWAPAWVSWHQSPEYIGWSPLPPDRGFFIEIGFVFNSYDSYYYKPYRYKHHYKKRRYKKHRYYHDYYHNPHKYRPPAKHCVFLPYNKFGNHKQALKAAVPPPHYDVVLRNSKNVTNIKYVNKKVINYGPDKHYVEKRSNRKLVKHNIVDTDTITLRGNRNVNRVKGDSYKVYRPKIERNSGNKFITNRGQAKTNHQRQKVKSSPHNQQHEIKNGPYKNDSQLNQEKSHRQYRPLNFSKQYEKNNQRDNPDRRNIERYKANKKNIGRTVKPNQKSRYKESYSYQQKNQVKNAQPYNKPRVQSNQRKNTSTKNKRVNNYEHPRNRNIQESKNHQHSRYGNQNSHKHKQKESRVNRSHSKSYSNNNQRVRKNNTNVSQRNSYKQKTRSVPSSRKSNFSRR